jgi:hypothetical protein
VLTSSKRSPAVAGYAVAGRVPAAPARAFDPRHDVERKVPEMEDRRLTTSDLAEAPNDDTDEATANADEQPGTSEDADASGAHEPLLPDDQSERFTTRWQEIQTGFVDEPRSSVEQADALVADLMQRLAASFSNERQQLEAQWDSGDDVSTEDLRVALTRYRSFFDRLLSA